MAAGKTSLGRRVAKDLGVPFVDTDVVFTRQHGAITDFFAQHGEAAFREMEHQAVVDACAGQQAVIATGGGVLLREDNRAIVRAASQASKAADWLLAHLPEPAAAEATEQGRAAA